MTTTKTKTFAIEDLEAAALCCRDYWATGGRTFDDMLAHWSNGFPENIAEALAEGDTVESAVAALMENGFDSVVFNARLEPEEIPAFIDAMMEHSLAGEMQ